MWIIVTCTTDLRGCLRSNTISKYFIDFKDSVILLRKTINMVTEK